MSRWFLFTLCALLGLAMFLCGLLMPAHLRAIDDTVLSVAGRGTPSIVEEGLTLVKEQQLGAAEMFLEVARQEHLAGTSKLGLAVGNLAMEQPELLRWGGEAPLLDRVFGTNDEASTAGTKPVTDFLVRDSSRAKVLDFLSTSRQASVQALLGCRLLTNTVIFSPSQSASGQALDTAVSLCGLLLEQGRLGFSPAITELATKANAGQGSQPLEQVLLDLMSLGQRFNWDQLVVFVSQIESPQTLRVLADRVRNAGKQLPLLFAAVRLSGDPAGVGKYLMKYSKTGFNDLAQSARMGAGALKAMVAGEKRPHPAPFWDRLTQYTPFAQFTTIAVDYSWRMPWLALGLKWLLYFSGGFWIAAAGHFMRRPVSPLEAPLQVRGFHLAREVLFAFGFLLVVLLLSEPFLAQQSQRAILPFRLHLSLANLAAPMGKPGAHASTMNDQLYSLLTLLLFFVLQGLIYTACVIKLAEIRRQRVVARIKLKLLENEEHLFDAGLYLGFVGTIICLILASFRIITLSLMAAYSSTSFGIIFVSVFKIFNLRPVRRRLLLEAEANSAEAAAPVTASGLAASS